ncbi:MAG: conjugal transfer protein TrbE, partial [Aquidulcibacter sp.]
MRFLDEYRKKPISLADHLPWAALVAPGVILNKDGSFSACVRFRGPDLESSTPEELMAVRARLNNMLRRLGTGWCLHLEARRRAADPYPHTEIATPIAWLVDQERRALFDEAGNSFETDHVATLTWLPPPDEARRAQSFLFENRATNATRDWRETLALFEREIGILVDLIADALPEAGLMSDEETLTYLHSTISTKDHSIAVPETPVFLDAQLADTALQGGIAPKLGSQHLRVVGVRSFPAKTLPGLLDALGQLPFTYRWVARWIALDKAGAETELLRLRKRWFAKRKGIGTLMREAITKEDVPLVDTDAAAKTDECDGALEALGAEVCAFGYLTLTVTVMDRLELRAIDKARAIEASLNAQGFVAATEDLNAVEAWLGSLPGEPYADVRRPMISTLNLCDLLPISAVWAGPSEDSHLAAPPLLIAETSGATPFRL